MSSYEDTGRPTLGRSFKYVKIAGEFDPNPNAQAGDILAGFDGCYPREAGVIIQPCVGLLRWEERPVVPKGQKAEIVAKWSAEPRDVRWDERLKRRVRQSNGHTVSMAIDYLCRHILEDNEDDASVWRFSYLDRDLAQTINGLTRRRGAPEPVWNTFLRLTTEEVAADQGVTWKFRFARLGYFGEPNGPDEEDVALGREIADEGFEEARAYLDLKAEAEKVVSRPPSRGSATFASGKPEPPPTTGTDGGYDDEIPF